MIPRMTTTGSLKGYRYNLQRSTFTLNKSITTVMTGRAFNSFAEDPTTAAQSFRLRRAYLRTSTQYNLNESVVRKYDVAFSSMTSIEKVIDTDPESKGSAYYAILRALNDPDASGRNALGQEITAHANDMVQFMNGRYGDNFVFSGADALNVPLTWEPTANPDYAPDSPESFKYLMDDGTGTNNTVGTNDPAAALRELNPDYDPTVTDPADPKSCQFLDAKGEPTNDPAQAAPRANPDYDESVTKRYLTSDGEPTDDEFKAGRTLCYRGVPVDSNEKTTLEKLDYISKGEKKYVDIGLGYDMNGGKVESSSVYNIALQAVNFLGGYGQETRSYTIPSYTDDDGVVYPEQTFTFNDIPKNIVSITDEIGTILQRCSPDNGKFASAEDEARFNTLVEAFEESAFRVKDSYTELTTQAQFLKNNQEQLASNAYTINEQIQGIDYVDPAAAISDFIFAKYCYDTALKVGNSILNQTLMDYMNFT